MSLITDEQLAAEMSIPLERLHTLRQQHDWPCTRLGRFIYRFTPEQVAQIIAMHTEGKAPAPEKPARQLAAVTGQTKRSASRSRDTG